jgi:hypothetical protein
MNKAIDSGDLNAEVVSMIKVGLAVKTKTKPTIDYLATTINALGLPVVVMDLYIMEVGGSSFDVLHGTLTQLSK